MLGHPTRESALNPIQDGLFWGYSQMGRGGAKSPPPP